MRLYGDFFGYLYRKGREYGRRKTVIRGRTVFFGHLKLSRGLKALGISHQLLAALNPALGWINGPETENSLVVVGVKLLSNSFSHQPRESRDHNPWAGLARTDALWPASAQLYPLKNRCIYIKLAFGVFFQIRPLLSHCENHLYVLLFLGKSANQERRCAVASSVVQSDRGLIVFLSTFLLLFYCFFFTCQSPFFS